MRQKEHQLSAEIRNGNFSFLEPGRYTISEIYKLVNNRFPDLCDNQYLCSQNCKSGHNHPEWFHVVRGCLQNGKAAGIIINTNRGVWQKQVIG